MDWPLAALVLAAVVFVVTDVDDLLFLVAFFADPRYRARDIVAGQYLGIATLFAASLAAAWLSLAVAREHVGLLGILPILIGARALWATWRGEDEDEPGVAAGGGRWRALTVASVTIANGGDNIGVYTPLFATRSGPDLVVFGIVFALLVAAWCLAARWLVTHPLLGAPIREYGHRVVPFVLIAVGLLILFESGSYRLLA